MDKNAFNMWCLKYLEKGKMINKKWIVIILGIFLISFVVGSMGSLGVFKQNSQIRLIQTCEDCSFVNITTLLNPNSSIILSNIPMTKTGTTFYYDLNTSYNNNIGTYTVNGIGNPSSGSTTWTYTYDITPSGREKPNSGEGITFLASVIVMFLISLIFFLISTSFRGNDNAMTGTPEAKGNPVANFFFIAMAFIVGLITVMYIMVALSQTYAGFSSIITSFTAFQYVIISVFFVMFIFVLINLTIKSIESLKYRKGLTPRNRRRR